MQANKKRPSKKIRKSTALQENSQKIDYNCFLGGRFGFTARGGGKGESEASGGGGSIFIEIPGGVGGVGGGGAEGPGGCLRRIGELGGRGLNSFFWSRNVHQVS